jgi:hypothetical protein
VQLNEKRLDQGQKSGSAVRFKIRHRMLPRNLLVIEYVMKDGVGGRQLNDVRLEIRAAER